MANSRAATVLQDARAFIQESNNKKFELRPEMTKLLSGFMRDREFTIPNLSKIKTAEKRATHAMYKTAKAFTIGTEKNCSLSGETSGSSSVELTWAQRTFTIVVSEKMYQNNEIGMVQGLADDLLSAEKSLFLGASGVDAILLAYLEANKTQVNALSGGGGHNTWNAALNQVEVANADIDRFYNYLLSEMALNNYDGEMLDFVNTMWGAEWGEGRGWFLNQGESNSTNTAFQFENVDVKMSNLIVPSGYNRHVHYIVPTGGVAFLDWTTPLNRKGMSTGKEEWGTADSLLVPDLTFDTYTTYGCADTTDNGGSKQDLVTNIEFTLNYAIAKQPFSVANESSIYKYVNLIA